MIKGEKIRSAATVAESMEYPQMTITPCQWLEAISNTIRINEPQLSYQIAALWRHVDMQQKMIMSAIYNRLRNE